jgi:hypothetical protein
MAVTESSYNSNVDSRNYLLDDKFRVQMRQPERRIVFSFPTVMTGE